MERNWSAASVVMTPYPMYILFLITAVRDAALFFNDVTIKAMVYGTCSLFTDSVKINNQTILIIDGHYFMIGRHC